MAKPLSNDLKELIIKDFEDGQKQVDIAKKYRKHQSTISRTISNFKKRKSLDRAVGSGRKSLLNDDQKLKLYKKARKEPFTTSKDLAEEVNKEFGVNVSSKTIRRNLKNMGVTAHIPAKKPFLTQRHKVLRYEWSKKYIYWNINDWSKVLWSDETKINLEGSDGKYYVYRKENERYEEQFCKGTVKYGGGSIMIWACFSSTGVGEISIIEGTMTAIDYKRILCDHLEPSLRKLGLDDYVFQQDNDPKHTSKLIKEFFIQKEIAVLDWPSQSPDMNPIENLFNTIKRKLYKRRFKSKAELIEVFKEEWNKIDIGVCKKLVSSMIQRVEALYAAKGSITKY